MDKRVVSDLLGFVVASLRARVGEWQCVAKDANVPYSTVCKIGQGVTPNPRIGSVQKLANYFARSTTNSRGTQTKRRHALK